MVTVQLEVDGHEILASCINMAGDHACSIRLPQDGIVADLQSSLCEKMNWASMLLWEESEPVCGANQLSKYSVLVGQVSDYSHLCGSYLLHQSAVHPAGYSSSGTNMICILVLEPGKAGLLHHFKGDYKRAEELRQLVMLNAQWCVRSQGLQKEVRISGPATVDHFYCHERSGYNGVRLSDCNLHVEVTIPLEQLEQGQREEWHAASTPGSGWTCGTEEYKSAYFLPASLFSVLRTPPEDASKPFLLQQRLNPKCLSSYPYSALEPKYDAIDQRTVDAIRFFRERLSGRLEDISIDEALKLQDEHMEAAKLEAKRKLKAEESGSAQPAEEASVAEMEDEAEDEKR